LESGFRKDSPRQGAFYRRREAIVHLLGAGGGRKGRGEAGINSAFEREQKSLIRKECEKMGVVRGGGEKDF